MDAKLASWLRDWTLYNRRRPIGRYQGRLHQLYRCAPWRFHAQRREEWENNSLGRFLEALSNLAEVGTMMNADEPTWRAFAELIAAAMGYE